MRATLRMERHEPRRERLDLTMDGPHLAYAQGAAGESLAAVRVKRYASTGEAEAAYRAMVERALALGFLPARGTREPKASEPGHSTRSNRKSVPPR